MGRCERSGWAGSRDMPHIPLISDLADFLDEIRDYVRDKKLQKQDREDPILLTATAVGDLRFNRQLGWFETAREWNGHPVQLTLSGEWGRETPDCEAALGMAKDAVRFWQDEAQWLQRLEACAVADLLELAKEWNEETCVLSEADFRGRIVICSLEIYENGEFGAWFKDGDLFTGHGILVSGSFVNGPSGAEIQG